MRAKRVAGGLLKCFLLALCLGLSPRAGGLDEIRSVLRKRVSAEAPSHRDLVADLAALGNDALPVLYSLVTGVAQENLVGEEWIPAEWSCTPEEISDLCARALEQAPAKAVIEHLSFVLDGSPEPPERLIVLRLLGGLGSSEGLELVLRCLQELGDLELLRPRVTRAALAALTPILSSSELSWGALDRAMDDLLPSTRGILVEAIGASGRAQGMALLERQFSRGELERGLVEDAMARLECQRPWDLAGRTMQACTLLWRSQDPGERAHAARLAGSLGALREIPELIDFLDDREALVRNCARQALERLAVVPVGTSSDEWNNWYERELTWREERWPKLFETLVGPRPGPSNEALRELALHPLYRHEVADVLARELPQMPNAVALSACGVLQRLESRWALPGLVNVLEGSRPRLRAAAWRALQALTGEERQIAAHLWRPLIES